MPTEIPETDVDEALAFYVQCHPRYRPGEAARKAVRKALKAGYSIQEIKDAIRGNAKDRWCVSVRKFDLPYVLREGIIDQFIEKANNPKPKAAAKTWQEREAEALEARVAVMQAAQERQEEEDRAWLAGRQ